MERVGSLDVQSTFPPRAQFQKESLESLVGEGGVSGWRSLSDQNKQRGMGSGVGTPKHSLVMFASPVCLLCLCSNH